LTLPLRFLRPTSRPPCLPCHPVLPEASWLKPGLARPAPTTPSTSAPWPSSPPCSNAWTSRRSSTATCPPTPNRPSPTARSPPPLPPAPPLSPPPPLPTAPAGAADPGADLLWDLPAESLNDDRLGRALDAFFTQRPSILTAVAAQALPLADLPRDRLHFDPTH